MIKAQAYSLARTLVQMLFAYAVGKGWIDPSIAASLTDQVVDLLAAAVTVGLTLYGAKRAGIAASIGHNGGPPLEDKPAASAPAS